MTTVQEREMLALGQAEVVSKNELTRLRGFEAREALVANTIVCLMEALEAPMKGGLVKLLNHISQQEADLSRAIECLARRDMIRRLEGAVEALRGIYHEWGDEPLGQLVAKIERLEPALAKARAGK